ncbi:MAG: GTP-binding protein YchF [Candidatus Latescibacterota bacterium]|jgi:GTP-binding protein YchF
MPSKGKRPVAINIGIVGLPNVGKSTLFNALSAAGAESANFPFCTIEPNVGVVPVPDERLDQLAKIFSSEKIIPTSLEFVDIAGLVKGASQGEGLGNQFLGNIRECNAIAHVVRCFDDDNIVHVDGSVDPLRDIEVIDTELCLADLSTVEKRISRASKMARSGDKEARAEMEILEPLSAHLDEGKSVRFMGLSDEQRLLIRGMHLLTDKPVMYLANVSEGDAADPDSNPHVQKLKAAVAGAPVICMSAAIEAEISQLDEEEQKGYLESLGLSESGLDQVIREGYTLLDLITYLTAGPKETRAWTVKRGASAPEAAGVIHTDFQHGFIKAEVMRVEDLVELGGEAAMKAAGKLRIEGKEYTVVDGDVMHFRFNV